MDNNLEIPDWVLDQINYLNKGILLQEVFQYAGFIFAITIQFAGVSVPALRDYTLFVYPLFLFAICRSDYLLKRNGAKIWAYERSFKFNGNEYLQSKGGSHMALFDIIVFAGAAFLVKALSPYPITDLSTPSIWYWILCSAAFILVPIACQLGWGHKEKYREWLG